MDSQFKTSFIPKKPLAQREPSRRFRVAGIFSVFVFAVFLVVAALAGGVFLYKQLVTNTIKEAQEDLDLARDAFEPGLIAVLKRTDLKIKSAQELLNRHIAVTPLFELLELNTLQTIRFSDFDYEFLEETGVSLSLSGQARNFSAIALQADLFSDHKDITEPVFSSLEPDTGGLVNFSFDGVIDPRILLFENAPDNVIREEKSGTGTTLPPDGSTSNTTEILRP